MARVCRAVPCYLRDGRSICCRARDRRDKAYVLLSRRYVCGGDDDVTAWSDATPSRVDRKTCGDHVFTKRRDVVLAAVFHDLVHALAFGVLPSRLTVGPVGLLVKSVSNFSDVVELFGCWLAVHSDVLPTAKFLACLALSARTYVTVSGPLPLFQTAQMSRGAPQ